jgi:hypothetical protein
MILYVFRDTSLEDHPILSSQLFVQKAVIKLPNIGSGGYENDRGKRFKSFADNPFTDGRFNRFEHR